MLIHEYFTLNLYYLPNQVVQVLITQLSHMTVM